MIVYGLKNCNTTQEALKLLQEKEIEFIFYDFKKYTLSDEKIKEWFGKIPWERFINKKGTTWRNLNEGVKRDITGPDQAMVLMQLETSIIKRPVVEMGDKLLIGLDELASIIS